MKKIFLIITISLCCCTFSLAQNQKKLFELRILEFTKNGEDYTSWIAERKQSFIFYIHDGEDYLANYCNSCTDNTQSHGRVYNFNEVSSAKETDKQYGYTNYSFTWRYFNSYDNKSGSADVKLFVVYKPNGNTFTMKVILSNMDVMIYKGYIEESMK